MYHLCKTKKPKVIIFNNQNDRDRKNTSRMWIYDEKIMIYKISTLQCQN